MSPHVIHRHGSMVFHLPEVVVAFEMRTRSIWIEQRYEDASEADTVCSIPFASAHAIRVAGRSARPRLSMEMVDGEIVELGVFDDQEEALHLAWALGDLVHCSIEVETGGSSQRAYADSFYDAPTQRISVPPEGLPDEDPPAGPADPTDDLVAELTDVFPATEEEPVRAPRPTRPLPGRNRGMRRAARG